MYVVGVCPRVCARVCVCVRASKDVTMTSSEQHTARQSQHTTHII